MAPARPRRATHLGESWSVRPLLVHNTAAYKEKTLCRRAAAAGSTHIACYNRYRGHSAIAPGSLRSCMGGAADAAGGMHRRCDPPGPRGGGHCPHGGHDCADGIHGRQDSLPIVVPVGKAFDLAVRLVQLPSSDTETTGTVKVWLCSAVMQEMHVAVVTPPPPRALAPGRVVYFAVPNVTATAAPSPNRQDPYYMVVAHEPRELARAGAGYVRNGVASGGRHERPRAHY